MGRRKRRARSGPRWARVLVGVGVVLMTLSLLGMASAVVLKHRIDAAMDHDDLLGDGSRDGRLDLDGPMDFLLVGSDQRVDSTKPGLADTIIVAHVPEGAREAYLVSIPRDTWTVINCNGELKHAKLNAAYACGGNDRGRAFQSLAAAVNAVTGLRFDGGAIVDFEGFADVVGVFGSVRLCLEKTITSIHTGKTFPQGCAEYGKDDALDIVRQRYQYADGDYARQRMEQQFLKALFERAVDEGYVSNPAKIGDLIDAVGSSLTIDTGGVAPTDLAYALRHIDPGSLTMVRTPSDVSSAGDQSIIALDPVGAPSLFAAITTDRLGEWTRNNPQYVNRPPG